PLDRRRAQERHGLVPRCRRLALPLRRALLREIARSKAQERGGLSLYRRAICPTQSQDFRRHTQIALLATRGCLAVFPRRSQLRGSRARNPTGIFLCLSATRRLTP